MADQNVSLRDYIDTCIKGEEAKLAGFLQLVTQHFELNALAIKKAEEAMLIRLESMNQFRAQILEERADFATKEQMASIMEAQDKRIKDLELTRSFSAGKMWMAMAGFAAIPTILALIALFAR